MQVPWTLPESMCVAYVRRFVELDRRGVIRLVGSTSSIASVACVPDSFEKDVRVGVGHSFGGQRAISAQPLPGSICRRMDQHPRHDRIFYAELPRLYPLIEYASPKRSILNALLPHSCPSIAAQ